MSYLAKNLQNLRKIRQLSQQVFAERLGLTRSKVASYESGKAEPNVNKLLQIARFFDISINQLIEEDLKAKGLLAQYADTGTNLSARISPEEQQQILNDLVKRSEVLQKITAGFRALHELRREEIRKKYESMPALVNDFENTLDVMDKLAELNREILFFIKK